LFVVTSDPPETITRKNGLRRVNGQMKGGARCKCLPAKAVVAQIGATDQVQSRDNRSDPTIQSIKQRVAS
jgi:hypothetical protein